MAKGDTKDRGESPALAQAKFMQQIGKSGIIMLNGVISKEEYNRDLTGARGLEVWNKMRRGDGTVRAALMVVKLPILAANWQMEAGNDSPAAKEAMNICKASLFENNNWESILREALTMFDFGYSTFEQVFEIGQVDNKDFVLLKDLLFMKQDSIKQWAIGENKDEPGVTQLRIGGDPEAEIPWIKLSVFTHEKEGDNHAGVSLLRAAYKHWYIKDSLYQIDALAHEKQGLGILKVKTPATAKEDDKEEARDIAREQRANEEAYIEEVEGFTFEFMDMKARTTRDIMPSISHHDRMILQSVLAQFLAIGSDSSSGSLAASDNQTELFLMSEEAAAKTIQSVMNDTVIRNICLLNGVKEEDYPRVKFGRIGQDTLAVFSEALNKLFTAGVVTPDPEIEAYVRKTLHMPEMTEDMVKNYDTIRAARRNVSNPFQSGAPTPAVTGTDGFTKEEADLLIKNAKKMRDNFKGAKRATSKRKAT